MDTVLIPYQNKQYVGPDAGGSIPFAAVRLGALAWGLGWAKTYILALVSERIGADLRTTTYEHLLRMSLEYFGGKRTGDLMSRIGSESDRICVFLSLHLLDFATDVLMILMTTFALFSLNGSLAIATLLPLPFIAWMIHVVRDKLKTGFETHRPRLVGSHQCAGRYHTRHPRGQGLRAGKARSEPLSRRQPAQSGWSTTGSTRSGRCSRPASRS